MPGFVGVPELLLLGLVVLLVFGPKRLPEIGRSLGKGMRDFKDSISGTDSDDDGEGTVHSLETEPVADEKRDARRERVA